MSYKVNTSSLKSNMKRVQQAMQKQAINILKKGANAYATGAMQYVPPQVKKQWSKKIPKELYKRKVFPISILIKKDTKNKKEYAEKLKQGFRFVILGKLHGKAHKWYSRTLRQANKFTRIFNRGYFKIMFGLNLPSIGEIIPKVFRTLLNKSKNLAKFTQQNKFIIKQGVNTSIKIQAGAVGNERFASIANKKGQDKASKTMKKYAKNINEIKYKV